MRRVLHKANEIDVRGTTFWWEARAPTARTQYCKPQTAAVSFHVMSVVAHAYQKASSLFSYVRI